MFDFGLAQSIRSKLLEDSVFKKVEIFVKNAPPETETPHILIETKKIKSAVPFKALAEGVVSVFSKNDTEDFINGIHKVFSKGKIELKPHETSLGTAYVKSQGIKTEAKKDMKCVLCSFDALLRLIPIY